MAIAVTAPFLLPVPVYNVIYGWQYPKQWQVGDGMIKDAGPMNASRRYTVELANLVKPESMALTLQLTSLPEVELTLGFNIQVSSSDVTILETKPISARVHLRVENEKGDVVIDQNAPLNEWVWSGATSQKTKTFVYARGEMREVSLDDGSFRYESLNIKPDAGWGTYFTPRRTGRYTVKLKIHGLNSNTQLDEFRLVAYGGGWK